MNKYSYTGLKLAGIMLSQLSGVLGILIFGAFSLVLFSGIQVIEPGSNDYYIINDPRVTLVCLGSWFLLVSVLIGMIFINFKPTIWITDEGLIISAFIILRIQIQWSDIMDLDKGKPPKGHVLVRTYKITPFHRLYGWLYSKTLYPSFLIDKGINEYDALIREINLRIKKAETGE